MNLGVQATESHEIEFNSMQEQVQQRLAAAALGCQADDLMACVIQAAESRSMEVDSMQERAQGRVWSGAAALQQGLVDAIGGVPRAIAIAQQAAGLGACYNSSVVSAQTTTL